jgi:hypothetical protein
MLVRSQGWCLYIVMILGSIVGCAQAPESLGFSKAEWQGFSDQKKATILAQQRRLKWAVPVQAHQQGRSEVHIEGIRLELISGQAYLWPEKSLRAFKPLHAQFKQGECQTLILQAVEGAQTGQLKACYRDDQLALDPSPWAVEYHSGSAFFHSTLLWNTGLTYRSISTQGLAHLVNATVRIQALNL